MVNTILITSDFAVNVLRGKQYFEGMEILILTVFYLLPFPICLKSISSCE